MSTLVKLDRLEKSYGETRVIDGLTLEIQPSEFFSLLGPSGCGKTTTLRLIAGFETPDRGKIQFDIRDVTFLPPHKRKVGMVFQNYALFPHMNVGQNIAFGLKNQGMSVETIREKVEEMLQLVALSGYEARPVDQLSGGQQQRVALARALAIEPAILLLDEPLSNLDARLRIETRSQLRRVIRQTCSTAIYVTHDRDEALALSDRIGLLNAGRLEQIGTPEQLYQKPQTSFVSQFLGHTNIVSAAVEGRRDNETLVRFREAPEVVLWIPGTVPTTNTECKVVLRPESLRLHNGAGDNGQPCAPVIVREFEYRGNSYRYTIRLGGLNLEVDYPADRGRFVYEKPYIMFDPSRHQLLPK